MLRLRDSASTAFSFSVSPSISRPERVFRLPHKRIDKAITRQWIAKGTRVHGFESSRSVKLHKPILAVKCGMVVGS